MMNGTTGQRCAGYGGLRRRPFFVRESCRHSSHDAQQIAPQYVKPFLNGNINCDALVSLAIAVKVAHSNSVRSNIIVVVRFFTVAAKL
ncbi:hypothetical protein CBM2605_B150062 [Cupriavidus neocaledonicus]|uniref:Uncharacterized protein n=1 Tax=Cupriavidus neocaledonicus TaxID=1040979 RepID=A0ABY1V938_9BURK|nr:hypothetical protein CBM2605_B150062 [Cupriavidus neocaledonicus]